MNQKQKNGFRVALNAATSLRGAWIEIMNDYPGLTLSHLQEFAQIEFMLQNSKPPIKHIPEHLYEKVIEMMLSPTTTTSEILFYIQDNSRK